MSFPANLLPFWGRGKKQKWGKEAQKNKSAAGMADEAVVPHSINNGVC